MKKNKQGRVTEILFAIILLGFTGLTAFSFVQKRWQVLLEGWNNINGTFSGTLFEFNITAIAFLVMSCIIALFAFITAISVFANARVKVVFSKILFAGICIEKIIYCMLFMFKINSYWASPLVSNNMIVWILMIFVTMLELMVAVLLLLLACNKKIFAPVTLFFAIVLAVIMGAELVNTYVYTFFEIPLLPEVPIWQGAEILNEGIANLACYWSLCFALLGVFLSISKVRSSIKFGMFVPHVETIEESFFKDSVVVPKKIIDSEGKEEEYSQEEDEGAEEVVGEIAEAQAEKAVESEEPDEVVDDVVIEEETEIEDNFEQTEKGKSLEGIPDLLPEIDTDENFKFDVDLAAELEELFGGEEKTSDEDKKSDDEKPIKKAQKMAAQAVATELIDLTMRLQKGEIDDEEYNRLKKDLFDKL